MLQYLIAILFYTLRRSDPVLNLIQYTQFFPEKYLEGEYEGSSQVLVTPPDNRGVWNLTLCKYYCKWTN